MNLYDIFFKGGVVDLMKKNVAIIKRGEKLRQPQ